MEALFQLKADIEALGITVVIKKITTTTEALGKEPETFVSYKAYVDIYSDHPKWDELWDTVQNFNDEHSYDVYLEN